MSSAKPRAGRFIGDGKYELLSQIGNGAMGTVWLARHVALDRMVAVKMLGMVTSASSEARQRFLTEARSASLLRHPCSVRVLDYAAEGDECWFVMEFLEGRNLAELIAEQAPLAPRRAIAIAAQILAASAEAHEFGIVHRDLKPANIMLVPWVDDDGRETEQVKVLDFGIATVSHAGTNGEVAGTPEYMSPEQAQGLSVDPRSDVYSVATVLYQMLSGEVPLQGDDALATMLAQVNKTPRPLRERAPSISPRLEAVVVRALAKAPEGRHASARTLRQALLDLPEASGLRWDSSPRMRPVTTPRMPVAEPLPTSTPTSPDTSLHPTAPGLDPGAPLPARARRRWPLVAGAVALVGAGVAAAILLTRSEPASPVPYDVARALPAIRVPPPARIAPREPMAPPVSPVPSGAVVASAPDASAPPDSGPTAADTTPSELVVRPSEVAVAVAARAEATAPETPPPAKRSDGAKREPTPSPDGVRPEPVVTTPRERVAPTTPAPVEARHDTVAPPPAPLPSPAPEATHVAEARGTTSPERVEPSAPSGLPERVEPSAPSTPSAPVEPPAPKVPTYRPALKARVVVSDLVVKGSLPRSAVQRALDAMRPALEQCYRSAAVGAERDVIGLVAASVIIDVDGQAAQVYVGSFALPGFSDCARQALNRARSRERPDTGTATASFTLSVTPLAPEPVP